MTTNPPGYNLLHKWVRRYLPKPQLCEICNKAPATDLSNISGQYKRTLIDWHYLCRSCHIIKDQAIGPRQCAICGSDKTYVKKYNGRPLWQYVDGKVVCHACYCKDYYNRMKVAPTPTTT